MTIAATSPAELAPGPSAGGDGAATWSVPSRDPIGGAAASSEDDLALVSAYLDGDARAFDRLFQRYHTRVRAVCLQHVGDQALAEDLVQETFVNVIRALPRIQADLNFGAWIHRIAVNVSRDELRRRSRRALHHHQGGDPDEAILRVPDGDRAGHPEAALEMATVRQLVWEVAKKLPERQRMVLTLRELQGLPYASIARVMGITDSAVETLLHRARKRFREEYLLLDSPPEDRSMCADIAALAARELIRTAEQNLLDGHMETCALCRDATAPVRLPPAAAMAVGAV